MNFIGNEVSVKRPKLTIFSYIGMKYLENNSWGLEGGGEEALNLHKDKTGTKTPHQGSTKTTKLLKTELLSLICIRRPFDKKSLKSDKRAFLQT